MHFHQSNRLVERVIQTVKNTTETAIDIDTQNQLPTLKPGDTIRKRTNKEKTCNKKGSIFAPNDHACSYVLNEKGNLIIRNLHQIIPINERFIVKHNYENIIEPSETTSWKTVVPPRTDTPSNIVAPSV